MASLVGPGQEVIEVTRGQDVRDAVGEQEPDLVVLDLQMGNMGGIAVAIDLHLEESGGRLPHVPILLLLDREADRFLARRAAAEAVLVKPFDPGTLRRAVKRVVGGGDGSAQPLPLMSPTPTHNERPSMWRSLLARSVRTLRRGSIPPSRLSDGSASRSRHDAQCRVAG